MLCLVLNDKNAQIPSHIFWRKLCWQEKRERRPKWWFGLRDNAMMVVEFLEGVKECPKDILGPHVLRVQNGRQLVLTQLCRMKSLKYTFSLFYRSFWGDDDAEVETWELGGSWELAKKWELSGRVSQKCWNQNWLWAVWNYNFAGMNEWTPVRGGSTFTCCHPHVLLATKPISGERFRGGGS